MGTIRVLVEEGPCFTWSGGAVEVARALEDFRDAARSIDLAPDDFAKQAVWDLVSSGNVGSGEGAAPVTQMHMMAVLWVILTRETKDPRYPGTIGDHVSASDITARFKRMPSGGYAVEIESSYRKH
jgi:hypothetical protein